MYSKFLLVVALLFSYAITFSQKNVEHYYNYYGRECPVDDARYYSVEVKKDSGWYKNDFYVNNKKLMFAGLYEDMEDKIPNGTFYSFYPTGVLESVGKYIHW